MAVIQGVRSTENISQDARKFDHSDKLWYVSADYAVLAFFARKLKKVKVMDPEYRWFEKEQPSRQDAVNYATGYTTGATEITVDDGTKFRAGDVVRDVTAGEQFRVTVVATNVLTISRGWGDTVAQALVDDDVLVIIGNANAEGASIRAALTTQKTKKTNYTQIFREPIDITETGAATETYGGPDDLATLRKEHLDVHMKDIERAFLFGEPKEDTSTVGTDEPIRATGGLEYFLSTNVTADANGILTEAEFEDWIGDVFQYGGEKKFGLLSSLIASAVNSWAKSKLNMFPKDKTYGIAVMNYLSVHGEINFVLERLLTENAVWNGMAFAIDVERVGYRYLSGNGRNRDTKLLKDRQAAGDDKIKEEYLSEIGFWLATENRHGQLKGVTAYS